ncbi:hypothetical protein Syun_005131 [Stephania yunnanensis]|uniref:F-box domain-containing protein n=1 Tax=Stephania yunnanensis TaxID=152371 RepID=A0AAP0Q361_9MAGN
MAAVAAIEKLPEDIQLWYVWRPFRSVCRSWRRLFLQQYSHLIPPPPWIFNNNNNNNNMYTSSHCLWPSSVT